MATEWTVSSVVDPPIQRVRIFVQTFNLTAIVGISGHELSMQHRYNISTTYSGKRAGYIAARPSGRRFSGESCDELTCGRVLNIPRVVVVAPVAGQLRVHEREPE